MSAARQLFFQSTDLTGYKTGCKCYLHPQERPHVPPTFPDAHGDFVHVSGGAHETLRKGFVGPVPHEILCKGSIDPYTKGTPLHNIRVLKDFVNIECLRIHIPSS